MYPQSSSWKIFCSLVLAEVIWGVWPIVASVAIKEGFDPFVFVFYRIAGAATFLTILSVSVEGHGPWSQILPGKTRKVLDIAPSKDFPWRPFLLLGALMCGNFLGYIIGVAYTSGTQAALMQPLCPVVACLIGLATGSEVVSNMKLLGIFTSVMGAMFVVYLGQEEAAEQGITAGRRYQMGTLALVVNVICTATYWVLQKSLLRTQKPIFTTSMGTLIAACYMIVLTFLYAEENKKQSWAPWILTPTREVALAYSIIFSTALNMVILTWANKATTPSTITAFATLQPLITVAVGLLWLGVTPHHQTIYGGLAICVGLLLTVRAQFLEPISSDCRRLSEEAQLICAR